eukprot:scaffold28670_cov21-Tisochrysis_lutea.AAC.10
MFALVLSAGSTAATVESRLHIQGFMRELVACKLEDYVSPSGGRERVRVHFELCHPGLPMHELLACLLKDEMSSPSGGYG